MFDLLYHPCITLYHPKWNLFELKWSIGKFSVSYKVEDLVELDAYDTEQIGNTGWSEVEY